MMHADTIAYFSMEIGLEPDIPTYSGGLGMLAGDTVRSAADAGLPMVAVSLAHRKGYFRQRLDPHGQQTEEHQHWPVESRLAAVDARVRIEIEHRPVTLRAWRYDVVGCGGAVVPVFLLDASLEDNDPADRGLTDLLYGGDSRYRLCQETILGIGGVRLLRALGYSSIRRFHMNEGHASLLVVELGHELAQQNGGLITDAVVTRVKPMCTFTTHTPVPSGHDQFPLDLVARVITGYGRAFDERAQRFCLDRVLNMTYLALDNSRYVNGVAKRHGEISRHMFAQYKVDSITNGVHAATWAAPPIAALFDRHIGAWRQDNASLRYALGIPKMELWAAHELAKQQLLDAVRGRTGVALAESAFTVGFARRATAYKRADLLFHDLARLRRVHASAGPFQVLLAGKAHPHDESGKELIRRLFGVIRALEGEVRVVYLEDYDMALARLMVAGCDLWLNTPQPPLEASGTSGMKAAVNGVPQLSVLDGWWLEGCIEGVTGWAIGADNHAAGAEDGASDAQSLYSKLEMVVLPMYYRDQDRYIEVMRHAIALNGSFFNTERMVDQYVRKAYFA
ncbi:MAG: alpha-glucan family phosphorylase [Steroidobacteraceae bacterium]|jgi:starch phosphorylase|nr:alpha-glucan family phosphorylase [Steroidobacteraceae bacterium]